MDGLAGCRRSPLVCANVAAALQPLLDAGLVNLTDTLAEGERCSHNFEGNLQALDHRLVSRNLLTNGGLGYDIVHANAEFADQLSDRDPLLLSMIVPAPVPEPATALLAGLAAIGEHAAQRKQQVLAEARMRA